MEGRNYKYIEQANALFDYVFSLANKIGYPCSLDKTSLDTTGIYFFNSDKEDKRELARLSISYSLNYHHGLEFVEVSVDGSKMGSGFFSKTYSTFYHVGEYLSEMPKRMASFLDEVISSYAKKENINIIDNHMPSERLKNIEKEFEIINKGHNSDIQVRDATVITTNAGDKIITFGMFTELMAEDKDDLYKAIYFQGRPLEQATVSHLSPYNLSESRGFMIMPVSIDHIENDAVLVDLDK